MLLYIPMGSVHSGEKSGWDFLANAHGRVVAERTGQLILI